MSNHPTTTAPAPFESIVLDALRAGTMPIAAAHECYAVSVRLFGADDRDSIAYRNAISRHNRGMRAR